MNVKKTSVILFSLLSVFSLASCSMFKNLFHHDDDVEFNYRNFDNWYYGTYTLWKEHGFYIDTVSLKTYEGNVYEIPKDESIPNIILVSNYDYVYVSYKIYNPNKYEIIGLVFQGYYAIEKTENISVNRITSNIREGDYTIVEALFDKKRSTTGDPIDMAVLAKSSDKYFHHKANHDEYKDLFILNYSIVKPDNIEYEFVKKGGYIDRDGIKINRLNSYECLEIDGLLPEDVPFYELSYSPSEKRKRIVGASGIMNNSNVVKIDKVIVPYNFLINSFEGIEIADFQFDGECSGVSGEYTLATHVFSNPYANFDKAYLKEDGGCYLRTPKYATKGNSHLYYCLNELDKAYTGQDIKVNSSTKIIGGRSGIFERQYNSIMIPKSLQYYCRSFFDTYIFDNIYYEGTLREFRARRPVEYNNDKPSSKYLDESNPKLYFYSEGEPPLGSPYHFYHYNAEGGIERYVGYEV